MAHQSSGSSIAEVFVLYTELTKKAMRICYTAHKDQVDKGGVPYVFHPFHIAEQMQSEEAIIVALLHDVVEDTRYTIDELAAMGFSERVITALVLLTHNESVPYLEYVAKIKDNTIAKEVKLADLKHNSDLTRLDNVDDKTRQRVEKYAKAICLLES